MMIAQLAQISGHAPDFIGKRLNLYGYTDFITENRILLDQAEVDDEGEFHLQAEIPSIRYVQLQTDQVTAYLYMEPGVSYDVEYPLPPESEARSFGKKARTEVIFNNLSLDDINADIIDFNYNYELFFKSNYNLLRRVFSPKNAALNQDSSVSPQPKGQSAINELFDKTEDFAIIMDSIYANSDDPYFALYRSSVLADLMMNGRAERREIYERFIAPYAYHVHHPEFTRLHQRFYENSFNDIRGLGHQEKLDSLINIEGDYKGLSELLGRDDFLADKERKDFVLIMALKETWNIRGLSKEKVVQILESIRQTGQSKESRAQALELIEMLTARTVGFPLKDFEFEDRFNDRKNLSSFKGKPVLIEFWADWCTNCAQEQAMSMELAKEYKDVVDLLSIEVYSDEKTEAANLDVPDIIHATSLTADSPIIRNYRILSLPQYILVDENGIVMKEDCPFPSQGLEAILFKLKSDKKTRTRRRIGRKGNQ